METFLDDIINDVIEKEQELSISSLDIILLEIKNLEKQISDNFKIAEEEQRYIADWAIKRNSIISDKKMFLEKKVETYFKELNCKTLDLAHGKIQNRRTSPRLVITNQELFMQHATDEMLSVQKEVKKPDLNKLKKYWTMSRKIPLGAQLIESEERFSIKIKDGVDNGEK